MSNIKNRQRHIICQNCGTTICKMDSDRAIIDCHYMLDQKVDDKKYLCTLQCPECGCLLQIKQWVEI